MSVRLPLAFLLGLATAALVACGGGSNDKLLPATGSSRLNNDLQDIRQAIDQHACQAAQTALQDFNQDLQGLPASVDARLRARLREGYAKLADRVPIDCQQQTTTETTPTTTETTPTTTETTPTTTTTTPTTTTPPPTTTTTPPPTTPTVGNGGTTAP